MNLSTNFPLKELTHSDTAKERNIDNRPDKSEKEKLLYLVTYSLQPTRDRFGIINVTSGFRCPQLNQAIGGAAGSQHRYGEAADFRTPSAGLMEVFRWCRDNLKYGQLIYEAPEGKDPWIHISLPRIHRENMEVMAWDGNGYKLLT